MLNKTDSSITIRLNSDVKRKAQEIFSELGMDMSTAINLFLRQAIQKNGLPFDLLIRAPNRATLSAIEDAEKNKNMHGAFSSVSDLMDSLND